jgi:hypothetical protein
MRLLYAALLWPAMEPEIAFLMANLAEVGPHSRVLDPYAGCCSLLLAAGFLQEMEPPSDTQKMEKSDGCLVGVDASMGEDTEPIRSNFAAVGLSSRLASLSLRWDIAERLIKVRKSVAV